VRTLTPQTIKTLDGWTQHHAALFIQDKQDGPTVERTKFTKGRKVGEPVQVKHFSRDWIMLQLFNITYKDEFEHIVAAFRQRLGAADLADFEARLAEFPSRSDESFRAMLEEMRPAGYQPKEA
jgi:hypothetical protein